MSARDRQILYGIVELYVRDGAPVSSLKLKRQTGIDVSTATIRNVMVRLEREGFLVKPHTSSGRIPTDEAYRSYVGLMEQSHVFDEELSHRVREEIRAQAKDIGAIMAAASRALAVLSRNLAVVYGEVVQESRVGRVQLVRLAGARLLVVVTLDPSYERTTVLRMDRDFAPDVVARAEARINNMVAELTLSSAREALYATARDNVTDEGIIVSEVAAHRADVFSDPPAVELYYEEHKHMMEQPEMTDPKLLQLLLKLLHNRQYLTAILSERAGECPQITIGGEHREEELKPFSMVTAGYRLGGASGVLGVIGPTRMRYDLVLGLVDAAARELRAIGEEYF